MNVTWTEGKSIVKSILLHNVFMLLFYFLLCAGSVYMCYLKSQENDTVAIIVFILCLLFSFYLFLRYVAVVTVLYLISSSASVHVTNAKFIDTNTFECEWGKLIYTRIEYILAPVLFDRCIIISCKNKYYAYPV